MRVKGLGLTQFFSVVGSALVFFLTFPLLLLFHVSPDLVVKYGLDGEALSALYTGVLASSTSTALLLLFGVPLGYVLSRCEFPGKGLVQAFIDLPFLLPHGVAGIAVLLAYNSRAPIGSVLASLGLRVEDSFWGVVAAMMYVSAPLAVNALRDGFSSVSPRLEHVARSLGASQAYVFFRVTLPLTLRHLVTAAILSWARGLSEVGALLIVAYYPLSINVLIMERFWTMGLEAARATALPLLVISIASFVLARRLAGGLLGGWRRG